MNKSWIMHQVIGSPVLLVAAVKKNHNRLIFFVADPVPPFAVPLSDDLLTTFKTPLSLDFVAAHGNIGVPMPFLSMCRNVDNFDFELNAFAVSVVPKCARVIMEIKNRKSARGIHL